MRRNTSIDYSLCEDARPEGGLSGSCLRRRSYEILCELAGSLDPSTLIISVGGIDSADEAWRRIRAGASLIQVYTGLIYHGPGLIGRINRVILEYLERDGFNQLSDAVGVDRRS